MLQTTVMYLQQSLEPEYVCMLVEVYFLPVPEDQLFGFLENPVVTFLIDVPTALIIHGVCWDLRLRSGDSRLKQAQVTVSLD